MPRYDGFTLNDISSDSHDIYTTMHELRVLYEFGRVIHVNRSPIFGQPGIYHMYPAFAYCYQDCGSYMQRQGTHRVPAKGILSGSTVQCHGICFSLENLRDYDHWSVARTLIFKTCCKTRAEIALYRTQSHDSRTMSY